MGVTGPLSSLSPPTLCVRMCVMCALVMHVHIYVDLNVCAGVCRPEVEVRYLPHHPLSYPLR